jgi:hypothetical protein
MRARRWLFSLGILLLGTFVVVDAMWAQDEVSFVASGDFGAGESPRSVTVGDFNLTGHEGLLSLRAEDASLKAIVEAIGQQLSIEMVTRIPADERLTIAFDQLSLPEALTRLRPYVNYIAIEDATTAPGTIRQLIVVSKRLVGTPSSRPTPDGEVLASPSPSPSDALTPTDTACPQPFRFEFDPTTGGGRQADMATAAPASVPDLVGRARGGVAVWTAAPVAAAELAHAPAAVDPGSGAHATPGGADT